MNKFNIIIISTALYIFLNITNSYSIELRKESEWTIINYIAGYESSNDINEYYIKGFQKIQNTSSVNIITLIGEKEGASVYKQLPCSISSTNNVYLEKILFYPNYKLCDKKSFVDFMKLIISEYPSKKIMITFSFAIGCTLNIDFPSLMLRDNYSSERFYSYDLKSILQPLVDFRKQKIDIFCVDSGDKQRIDILYEIRNFCNIYIAGNDIQGFSWPYFDITKYLINNPCVDPITFSNNIIKIFSYSKLYICNIAAINLEYIDRITDKLDIFSKLLISKLDDSFIEIHNAENEIIQSYRFADFELVCNFLLRKCKLENSKEVYSDISSLIEKSIINKYSTYSKNIRLISILSPFTYNVNADSKMEFSKRKWNQFVKLYNAKRKSTHN